jgi:membrane protease subunit HflK
MAWNQPGEEKKRPPRNSSDDSALDDVLRRWQRRVQRLWRPDSGRGSAILVLVAVVVSVWLASGIYQIDANERGVVQRFGRFTAIEQPGHGWNWPYPIESLRKVNIGSAVNGTDDKALMLTLDQSLVDVGWSVQYRIVDPVHFLFQLRDQTSTLREVSEATFRELVGQQNLAALLDGTARDRLTSDARERIQHQIDSYESGIAITGVNMTDLQLPDSVMTAERDAQKAEEERRRLIEDAQGYGNDILPKAQVIAQRQLTEAQVYAKQTVADAEGEAGRFNELANAYAQAPDVTRSRIYIETMEDILTRGRKIVVDARGGNNVLYLPLDKLADVMRANPPVAAAAAGASGAGAPASQPTTASPGSAASPAPATPVAPGGDRSDQDERNRERAER